MDGITIAVPKGRLYQGVKDFLKPYGVELPDEGRRYFYKDFFGEGANLFIAKPKAIPQLLESGLCQFGFCGNDIMEDSNVGLSSIELLSNTHENSIEIVFATNGDMPFKGLNRPIICATEYPNIAAKYLVEDKGYSAYILSTTGATEGYANIGADCVIDVCETGATLRANGLFVQDSILASSTCLFGLKNVDKLEIINRIIKNSK